jgi:hypothetical protein
MVTTVVLSATSATMVGCSWLGGGAATRHPVPSSVAATPGRSSLPRVVSFALVLFFCTQQARAFQHERRVPAVLRPSMAAGSPEHAAVSAVDRWVSEVVIRHGLCPWAGAARAGGGLRLAVSTARSEAAVLDDLECEASRLLLAPAAGSDAAEGETRSLETTLLVCPAVREWRDDFDAFEAFVLRCGSSPPPPHRLCCRGCCDWRGCGCGLRCRGCSDCRGCDRDRDRDRGRGCGCGCG